MIAAIPSTIAAIGSWRNGRTLATVKDAVNGGLTAARVEAATANAKAEALKEELDRIGRKQRRGRTQRRR